jgi:hypothetical protein
MDLGDRSDLIDRVDLDCHCTAANAPSSGGELRLQYARAADSQRALPLPRPAGIHQRPCRSIPTRG